MIKTISGKLHFWIYIVSFIRVELAVPLYAQHLKMYPSGGIKGGYCPNLSTFDHRNLQKSFSWEGQRPNIYYPGAVEIKSEGRNFTPLWSKGMQAAPFFRRPLNLPGGWMDPVHQEKKQVRGLRPGFWIRHNDEELGRHIPTAPVSSYNPGIPVVAFDVDVRPEEKKTEKKVSELQRHDLNESWKPGNNNYLPACNKILPFTDNPYLFSNDSSCMEPRKGYFANCIIVPPQIYIENVEPIVNGIPKRMLSAKDQKPKDINMIDGPLDETELKDINFSKPLMLIDLQEKHKCKKKEKNPVSKTNFITTGIVKEVKTLPRSKKKFLRISDRKLLLRKRKGIKKKKKKSRFKEGIETIERKPVKRVFKLNNLKGQKRSLYFPDGFRKKRAKRENESSDFNNSDSNVYYDERGELEGNEGEADFGDDGDEEEEHRGDVEEEGDGKSREDLDGSDNDDDDGGEDEELHVGETSEFGAEDTNLVGKGISATKEKEFLLFSDGQDITSPRLCALKRNWKQAEEYEDNITEVTPEIVDTQGGSFGEELEVEVESNINRDQTTSESGEGSRLEIKEEFETGTEEEEGHKETDEIESSYAGLREECEDRLHQKCSCSLGPVVREVNKVVKLFHDKFCFPRELARIDCKMYDPIGNAFNLAADLKPRLISKKPKELVADYGLGPKEISPETLNELLVRDMPKPGINFYTFPSSNIEIPCFSDNIKLSPSSADSALYSWTHSNRKAITEGRMLEDTNHRGVLSISDMTFWDSDNYTCTTTYKNPDTEETMTTSFVHGLKVVVLPKLALHMLMHYKAGTKCDQEVLEMFELYMPPLLEKKICAVGDKHLCRVETYNPICKTKTKRDKSSLFLADLKSLWSEDDLQKRCRRANDYNEDQENVGEMEMSLNYEMDLGPVWDFITQAVNRSRCSPHCQQKISLKIMQILRESFVHTLTLPVTTSSGVTFTPELTMDNLKTIIACDGGLHLSEGFCVPCEEGFYSEEGSTQCSRCPPGFYQNKIASKSCETCPHPFKRGCFDLSQIKTVFIMILILLVPITPFIICCKNVKISFKESRKPLSKYLKTLCPRAVRRMFKRRKKPLSETEVEDRFNNNFSNEDISHISNSQEHCSRSGCSETRCPPQPPPQDFYSRHHQYNRRNQGPRPPDFDP